jgi:hypothetical protein
VETGHASAGFTNAQFVQCNLFERAVWCGPCPSQRQISLPKLGLAPPRHHEAQALAFRWLLPSLPLSRLPPRPRAHSHTLTQCDPSTMASPSRAAPLKLVKRSSHGRTGRAFRIVRPHGGFLVSNTSFCIFTRGTSCSIILRSHNLFLFLTEFVERSVASLVCGVHFRRLSAFPRMLLP